MKNTLAENMLRFGVKNLKAEDVKKIEEQTQVSTAPVQPWADINPNSWKFKDNNCWDKFLDFKNYVVQLDQNAAIAGTYGSWARRPIPGGGEAYQLNPNAPALAAKIANALAELMCARGYYKPASYGNFATVLTDSEQISAKLKRKQGGNTATPDMTIGNTQYGISDGTNSRGESMSQEDWTATLELITPAINNIITTCVIPKVTAPVKAAKPGTTAPIKQN